MSWFESISGAIQYHPQSTLSNHVKDSLATLAKYDRISHNLQMAIRSDEKRLQDHLESAIKDKSAAELLEIDESIYNEGLKRINLKRQRLTNMYEYQMKIAQGLYDLMDKKIEAFDAAMLPVASQLPNILPTTEGVETKVTKRKRSGLDRGDEFDAILDKLSLDPNEPKYCLCKRVSYGEMVACENPDCRIEWFHFKCVGLKKAPADPWFCPQCSSSNRNVNLDKGEDKIVDDDFE